MNISLIKNVIYNWAGLFGSLIYSFFMIPYIIRHLGDTNYGIWNLIMSVAGYVSILDFGIQSSVNRYAAKYRAVNDMENINSIYSSAIAVYGIIAFAAICVGALLPVFMDKIFNVPADSINIAKYVAVIMVLYSALELPLSVYGSILYSYQRFDILNIVSVIALAIQSVLLIAMFNYSSDLKFYCYVIVLVGLLKYSVYFISSKRNLKLLRFRFSSVSREMLSRMLHFSGITLAAIIASNIIFKTDNIVIGIFLDPAAITMYSVGFMITEYGSQLIGKMCNTLTPKFSEHHAREETHKLNALIQTSTRFSTLIGIPMGLAILVLGRDFIYLWLGPHYDLTYTVMAILMCARMCGFPTAPLYSMLYGIGSHHLILYTGIAEALLNLGLSLLLVKLIGLTGVAWGTFIPMLAGNILFTFLVFRKLNLNMSHWLKSALMKPFVLSAIFYAIIYFLNGAYSQANWEALILKGICMALVYIILVVTVGITKTERRTLIYAMQSKLAPLFNSRLN